MWPLVGEIVKDSAIFFGIDKVGGAINNYLSSSPIDSSSSSIPTSRKTSGVSMGKVAKKKGLENYSTAVNASLAVVAGAIMTGATTSLDAAKAFADDGNTKLDALKALNPESPLLQNQLHLKESVHDIVNAINTNTAVSIKLLGPIGANLSAISNTLIAISSTLLEISDTYSTEIQSSNDLPYVDTKTFYDLLRKGNISDPTYDFSQLGEQNMIRDMSNAGYSMPEIKQAISDYRKSNIPSSTLLDVNNNLNGLTAPSPYVTPMGNTVATPTYTPTPSASTASTPAVDYSAHLKAMADYARSALVVSDHAQTVQTILDLDFKPVASMSPMQLEAIHNATRAKTSTDINNHEFDDEDIPSLSDLMPTLNFHGRGEIFDTRQELLINSNPFMPSSGMGD